MITAMANRVANHISTSSANTMGSGAVELIEWQTKSDPRPLHPWAYAPSRATVSDTTKPGYATIRTASVFAANLNGLRISIRRTLREGLVYGPQD